LIFSYFCKSILFSLLIFCLCNFFYKYLKLVKSLFFCTLLLRTSHFCHYKLQTIDFVHYVCFWIFDPFEVLFYDIYIFIFLLIFCWSLHIFSITYFLIVAYHCCYPRLNIMNLCKLVVITFFLHMFLHAWAHWCCVMK